jgi:hypothetical protein
VRPRRPLSGEESVGGAPQALRPQTLHPGEPRSGEPSAQLAPGIR